MQPMLVPITCQPRPSLRSALTTNTHSQPYNLRFKAKRQKVGEGVTYIAKQHADDVDSKAASDQTRHADPGLPPSRKHARPAERGDGLDEDEHAEAEWL